MLKRSALIMGVASWVEGRASRVHST